MTDFGLLPYRELVRLRLCPKGDGRYQHALFVKPNVEQYIRSNKNRSEMKEKYTSHIF